MIVIPNPEQAAAQPIHYLPIATTLVAIPFATSLLRRYRQKGQGQKGQGLHLLWRGIGVVCFGLGTALESLITLFGNSPFLNQAWYVAGAVLGAYPLAQGSAYLLMSERRGHLLTKLTLPLAVVMAVLVFASPVDLENLESSRPGGAALEWRWVRYLTPLLNVYAVVLLVGGAAVSSIRYFRKRGERSMAVGNALIAVGCLLPAFGGGAAKAGTVEALYVAEFLGLILIGMGYAVCVRR